jgi:hypothetical protein
MISISARVMSVPERPCPTLLIAALAPFEPRTMIDCSHRGPAWNSDRCWLDGAATGASHVLVCQDDAVPCGSFAKLVRAAVEARPEAIISFFMHDHEAAQKAAGAPWVDQPIKGWGPALCMSSAMAVDYVRWAKENLQDSVRADDLRLLHYACNHGLPISCTLPSLVEHSPNVASTVSPRGNNREFLASRLYRGEQINWALPAYQAPGDTRAFLISRQHQRATG